MDISTTFRLSAAECRSAARNTPAIRWMLIFSPVFIAAGVVTYVLSDPVWALIYVGAGLAVGAELTARLFARRTARLLTEPWTLRMTDQAFAMKTAVSDGTVGWDAFSAAWERSRFWYLRQVTGMVSFIPKRALDTGQLAELAQFFAVRLPPPKIHWYNPRSWR